MIIAFCKEIDYDYQLIDNQFYYAVYWKLGLAYLVLLTCLAHLFALFLNN